MKNLILVLLTFIFFNANAQNPKTAVTNAAMSLEMYESDPTKSNELLKAKNDIDFAAGHEKTEGDPRVWRYRGKIHNRIAFNPKLKEENIDAALIALNSFLKSWDLEILNWKKKEKALQKFLLKTITKPVLKMPVKLYTIPARMHTITRIMTSLTNVLPAFLV
jgi:hypothetical protein